MDIQTAIGARLKEERERVSLTIPELGKIAGAKKNTVIDWQSGKSSPPAAKLAELGDHGLDVLYILTGQRSGSETVAPSLSREHRALIDNYDACSPADQKAVRALASSAAKFHQLTGGKKRKGRKT